MEKYSYTIAWSDEDAAYVALSPEFPGISGIAETVKDAVSELQTALALAVETYQEEGWELPAPHSQQRYSGKAVGNEWGIWSATPETPVLIARRRLESRTYWKEVQDSEERWDALFATPESERYFEDMVRRVRGVRQYEPSQLVLFEDMVRQIELRTQAVRLATALLYVAMGQRKRGSNGWRPVRYGE
ncbi:MAG TPA: type II toxin-antitoxin system HicB family antitoxin [Roseiflexaceae bacterium]|nr:type II toxin-antitoxin system HicB family antitoxin [Roseiflexaceae bacterium]